MKRIFTIGSKKGIGQFMADLATTLNNWDERKPIHILIEEKKDKRSTDQNSLYWKWISMIADHVGDSVDAVHGDIGMLYLPRVVSAKTGNSYPISTTKLSTSEMFQYMEKVQNLAASMGIKLPTPDDIMDYSVYER